MTSDLEERERAFKRAKVDKEKDERERLQENERIKEEGRRMREEREKKAEQGRRAQEEPAQSARPEIGVFLVFCLRPVLTLLARSVGYDS